MAMIYKDTSKINKKAVDSDYCEICAQNYKKANKVSIAEAIRKFTGKIAYKKVISINKYGRDYCICPECALKFLKENYMDLIIKDEDIKKALIECYGKETEAAVEDKDKTSEEPKTAKKNKAKEIK